MTKVIQYYGLASLEQMTFFCEIILYFHFKTFAESFIKGTVLYIHV